MKRRILICALCLLLPLSACGGGGSQAVVHDDAPVSAQPVQPAAVAALEPAAWEGGGEGTAEIRSLSYDLGEQAVDGAAVPIRGWLALPEEGEDLPLVLILHGNHAGGQGEARFDEGFSYLAEYLARRGYAAASLDLQSAYARRDDDVWTAEIARAHLDLLRRAGGGEALFPLDLTGRLDPDRVILVGHSRGGDAALNLACAWEEATGVCAVAPNLRQAEKDWRDIPAAILVPQLDGDVDTMDGHAYLWPRRRAGLESPTVLTLLEGANHNFFNAKLTGDDAEPYGGATLTGAEQRDFLCRYAADFCDAVTGRGGDGFLDSAGALPDTRCGLPIHELWLSGEMELLSDAGRAAAVWNCQTRRLTVDAHTTDLRIPLSWGTEQTLTFWEGSWEGAEGALDLPLGRGDLGGFSALALDLAAVEKVEGLSLALTDREGNSAAVALGALEPLRSGSGYTLFSQVRLPLDLFQGVDLDHIARCSLLAGGGTVWVSAVWGC